jgi:hypothetical protein
MGSCRYGNQRDQNMAKAVRELLVLSYSRCVLFQRRRTRHPLCKDGRSGCSVTASTVSITDSTTTLATEGSSCGYAGITFNIWKVILFDMANGAIFWNKSPEYDKSVTARPSVSSSPDLTQDFNTTDTLSFLEIALGDNHHHNESQ